METINDEEEEELYFDSVPSKFRYSYSHLIYIYDFMREDTMAGLLKDDTFLVDLVDMFDGQPEDMLQLLLETVSSGASLAEILKVFKNTPQIDIIMKSIRKYCSANKDQKSEEPVAGSSYCSHRLTAASSQSSPAFQASSNQKLNEPVAGSSNFFHRQTAASSQSSPAFQASSNQKLNEPVAGSSNFFHRQTAASSQSSPAFQASSNQKLNEPVAGSSNFSHRQTAVCSQSSPAFQAAKRGNPFYTFKFGASPNAPGKSVQPKVFHRKVILLFKSSQTKQLTKKELQLLELNKLIIDDVEFNHLMTEDEVKGTVYDVYKLRRDIHIELVTFRNEVFAPYNPPSGKPIDGAFLLRNCRCSLPLYIKPSEDIPLSVELDDSIPPNFPVEHDNSSPRDDGIPPTLELGGNITPAVRNFPSMSQDGDGWSDSSDDIFLPKRRKTTRRSVQQQQGTKNSDKEQSEETPTVVGTLTSLKERRDPKAMFFLNLRRDKIVEDFKKQMPHDFRVLRQMRVSFKNEPGIDSGALSRDCLSMLLVTFANDTNLFVGDETRKTLTLNTKYLRENIYKLVGQIIQLSLLNDGPQPHFFSKHLYNLLFDSSVTLDESAMDFLKEVDAHMYAVLNAFQKADAATCNELLTNQLSYLTQWIGTKHFVDAANFEEDKKTFIKDVLSHYLIERIKKPIEQLREGLNCETKLLETMARNRSAFEPLFCCNETANITANDIALLFDCDPITEVEKKTMRYWERFIAEIEGGTSSSTFSEVLAFSTGSRGLPAIKYTDPPKIYFIAGEYPKSSSCFNILKLPRDIDSYEVFKLTLENCLKRCDEFLLP